MSYYTYSHAHNNVMRSITYTLNIMMICMRILTLKDRIHEGMVHVNQSWTGSRYVLATQRHMHRSAINFVSWIDLPQACYNILRAVHAYTRCDKMAGRSV